LKFLVDMPLSPHLAQWLVERGHDAVHAADIGLDRATDAEVIARARRDRRTAITADLDYPRLLALAGETEPSVILFRGGNWSDAAVISKMGALLDSIDELEMEQSILVIDADRVRRRRLPIK
jgi:predicted nuclease of predicted toxin-antitoxin system